MVNWSEPAKAGLRSIHSFIAHDSLHYAKKVTQDIVAKQISSTLPRMGRMVPELGNEDILELSLYSSYRILYENKDQDVFVLAVIHKRRDLQPEMVER